MEAGNTFDMGKQQMIAPQGCTGKRNLISDVAGIKVGHSVDAQRHTGVSVILPDNPALCVVDVRGGAPGGAETELLSVENLVDRVDALVLTGGSVFGLAAHSGVVSYLAEAGRGLKTGAHRVPIVPSAVIFDLPKTRNSMADYKKLGVESVSSASEVFELGNHGAGCGASAGMLKGGVGSASFCFSVDGRDVTVGAYAVVNSFGDVTMPGQGCFWAWYCEHQEEYGGVFPQKQKNDAQSVFEQRLSSSPLFSNTTLGVVAVDIALTKSQARRVAFMAQDGLARAIHPCHSAFDGDQVFVLSLAENSAPATEKDVFLCGHYAAECLARSVARGVYEADTLKDFLSWKSLYT
jgi:L-aminopeptidase/D-esterase-like protein